METRLELHCHVVYPIPEPTKYPTEVDVLPRPEPYCVRCLRTLPSIIASSGRCPGAPAPH